MSDAINKTVGLIMNPLFIGILLVAVALVLSVIKKRNAVIWVLGVALVWFWFWAMPVVGGWLAMPLERDYPVRLAEEMPEADTIVLMGGGVWGSTNFRMLA